MRFCFVHYFLRFPYFCHRFLSEQAGERAFDFEFEFVSSFHILIFFFFYFQRVLQGGFWMGFNGGLVRDFLILEMAVRLHFSWGLWVGFGNSSNMASTGQTVQ